MKTELTENRPAVIMLEDKDFKDFIANLGNIADKKTKVPDSDDIGIGVAINMGKMSIVAINKTIYDGVDEDEKDIIILHELAHCDGIYDEEEADQWVITMLEADPKDRIEAIETLIDMWPARHGHEYWEGYDV